MVVSACCVQFSCLASPGPLERCFPSLRLLLLIQLFGPSDAAGVRYTRTRFLLDYYDDAAAQRAAEE
jgi:hypothetical protein